jgi:hypothetical protein
MGQRVQIEWRESAEEPETLDKGEKGTEQAT